MLGKEINKVFDYVVKDVRNHRGNVDESFAAKARIELFKMIGDIIRKYLSSAGVEEEGIAAFISIFEEDLKKFDPKTMGEVNDFVENLDADMEVMVDFPFEM